MRAPSDYFPTPAPRSKHKPPLVELSDITDQMRLEHWHILARSGGGKTATLKNIIYNDLIRPDPPAIVVIEPKGDLVKSIAELTIFRDQPERLAIIDPIDRPALNFFEFPKSLANYDTETRAILTAKIIQSYSQAIASLDAELPQNQRAALINVVTLVLSMKNPTLDLLLDVLDDNPKPDRDKTPLHELSRFGADIDRLDKYPRRFFQSQFYEGQFRISRRSLSGKIQTILTLFSLFGEIFGAPTNELNLSDRLNTPGTVTLINTNQGRTSEDASTFFGRLMIGKVLSAAWMRTAHSSKPKPAFLFVDEAQLYFDSSLSAILTQTRSMGLGLTFAHHDLPQLNESGARPAAVGGPAIRFANPEHDDVKEVAAIMRTTPSFFSSLKLVRRQFSELAAYVKDIGMDHATRITIRHDLFDTLDKLDKDDYEALLERNRKRFSLKSTDTNTDTPTFNPQPSGKFDFGDA